MRGGHRYTKDRQAQTSWGDPEDARKRAVGQEGQHPEGSTPRHANIHSFIYSPNNYLVPSMCQSVPGPTNSAENKVDKYPCFHGVYMLIRKQKNKIKKYNIVLNDKGFAEK